MGKMFLGGCSQKTA